MEEPRRQGLHTASEARDHPTGREYPEDREHSGRASRSFGNVSEERLEHSGKTRTFRKGTFRNIAMWARAVAAAAAAARPAPPGPSQLN